MGTKSKNDWSLVWSIVAIVLSIFSISYCFTPIAELISSSWDRSSETLVYIARLVKGDPAG